MGWHCWTTSCALRVCLGRDRWTAPIHAPRRRLGRHGLFSMLACASATVVLVVARPRLHRHESSVAHHVHTGTNGRQLLGRLAALEGLPAPVSLLRAGANTRPDRLTLWLSSALLCLLACLLARSIARSCLALVSLASPIAPKKPSRRAVPHIQAARQTKRPRPRRLSPDGGSPAQTHRQRGDAVHPHQCLQPRPQLPQPSSLHLHRRRRSDQVPCARY